VKRVLVGTDLSPTSERAVAWAADMARRYDAELLVLRVVAEQGAAAHEELAAFAHRLAGDGARTAVVIGSDPAAAIVETARKDDVDVIVVGSIGMQGRKEFLLGNVPNRVSHNAPCTVVIVHTASDR
jgi:nucleotide-binding universal stress UspA family protein